MISIDQFGYNTFWWETLHTEEQLKKCVDLLAKLGYRHVEFKRDSFDQDHLPEQFKQAARITEAAGLKISNFVVLRDQSTGDAKAVDDVIETLAACSEAGVGLMNSVFGGPGQPIQPPPSDWWMPPQMHHETAWDNVVSAFEKICDAADRYGVTLAMEPMAGSLVCDFYAFQELFARFDHPRLGVTMDPSHLLLHRNDIPYAVRRLGDRIKHVHMKDAVGKPGVFGLDFMFPALGAGAIDWKAFLGALDDIGYQGALSGEYEQFKYKAHVRNNDPAYGATVIMEEMTALHRLAFPQG
jgi:sugar phosphate isomerase/epimerase